MARVEAVVPAPEGLATMGLSVPPGSDLALDLRLESVIEGVLASGTATARAEGECSRCLDPVTDEVTVDLVQLYAYPRTDAKGRVVHDDADRDEDEPTVVGDLLDLEPVVRDAVVLALPIAPVCRPDCPGLCAECGARLADDPGHQHDRVDPRWAALAGLTTAADGPGTDQPHDDRHQKEEG